MKKFQIAYIPIGVPTFHLESAQIQFEKSIKAIKTLTDDCVFPSEMLLSMDKLEGFLCEISPSLVIVQNTTFANSAYMSEIIRQTNCDVLLWTLREPVIDGGRLRLNSLTGAFSAGNAMKSLGVSNFEYVFGSPDEDEVVAQIRTAIAAAKIKHDLKSLKIAAIGHTPQGFGFGRATDSELQNAFGVRLESIEARELIDKAKGYSAEECQQYVAKFGSMCCGFESLPTQNMQDFYKLMKAYHEYVTANNIGAVASRCWPDFFVSYGTPVCGVLSMLNDMGVYSSCEADTFGALSMFIGGKLSGNATFFGDPVSLDEGENTITFWHCGMAACSLASGEKANIGVHPNRKIGPVMDFGCKAGEAATIFRVSKDGDGKFRFFVASGEILPKEKQFQGTSIVVKMDGNCKEIVENSVKAGFEPHYVVCYGDIAKELKSLGGMLNIPVWKF